MERETLDFAELLRSELPALLEARDGEPIALQTEEIGSDFNLAGDATRLRQMVSHLMSNVLKVAPSPGLRLIASQAEIEVEISDRGTPAAASRLRPMLEASDTSRGSDTHVRFSVLQIAVAKRVAALHGGSIMASAPDQSNGPAIIRIRLRR